MAGTSERFGGGVGGGFGGGFVMGDDGFGVLLFGHGHGGWC